MKILYIFSLFLSYIKLYYHVITENIYKINRQKYKRYCFSTKKLNFFSKNVQKSAYLLGKNQFSFKLNEFLIRCIDKKTRDSPHGFSR